MGKMGYDAVGITIADFVYGRDYLEQVRRKRKVPFVACNILDSKTNKHFVDPYVVKTAGDFVVAVIGLSSREDFQYPASRRPPASSVSKTVLDDATKTLTFTDPKEALDKTLKELRRHRPRPNVYALISAIDPRETVKLLKEFPQITVVLNDGQLTDIAPPPPAPPAPPARGAGEKKPPAPPTPYAGRTDHLQVDRAWIYHGAAQYTGKQVGQITLDYADGKIMSQEIRRISLDTKFADDPAVHKVISEFYAQVSKKVALEGTAEPKNKWGALESNRKNAFIGAESCSECHREEHTRWRQTRHADAALSLITANKHYHPDCASCHNTGYGYRTGFKIAEQTSSLSGVQCEACHGPGKLHRDSEKKEFIRAKPGKEYCVECHDKQQTPDLDEKFDEYYERVKHTDEAVRRQRPRLADHRVSDAPGKKLW